MTISNMSMQSALLLSDMPTEASMGGSMNIQLATVDGEQINLSENDFFNMLNQNMIQVVSEVDGHVIDNQELISMLGGLEANLEISNEEALPAQWMQFMKSHFSQQTETEQPLELVITEESQDEEDVILLQAELTQVDDVKDALIVVPVLPSNQLKGDVLPPERQTLTTSTIKPVLLSTQDEHLTVTDKVLDVATDEIDTKNGKLHASEDQQKEMRVKNAAEFVNVRQQLAATENAAQKIADSTTSATPLQAVNSTQLGINSTSTTQVLPPHLQALSVSTSANNQQWGDALGERVSFLINQKLNSAEIRIDPPHLGKLDIQIHIKDDSAQVVIHTQHAQTRDLVESSSLRLREILQDAGYSSVDVNVSHRDSSSQQNASSEAHFNSADDQAQSSDSTGLVEGVLQRVSMNIADGHIDYFA